VAGDDARRRDAEDEVFHVLAGSKCERNTWIHRMSRAVDLAHIAIAGHPEHIFAGRNTLNSKDAVDSRNGVQLYRGSALAFERHARETNGFVAALAKHHSGHRALFRDGRGVLGGGGRILSPSEWAGEQGAEEQEMEAGQGFPLIP